MKNEYKALMSHIKTPQGLNERVLEAAAAAGPSARQAASRPERQPSYFWRGPVFRIAVCAACSAALLLGCITFSKRTAAQPAAPELSFGIAAYAADTGELASPQDSRIAFELAGSASYDPLEGGYTGCLFRITGENIKTVAATLDKGGLYRMKTVSVDRAAPEGQAVFAALANGEAPEVEGCDIVSGHSTDESLFYFDACWSLGDSFSEEYDADASYGFWVPPADVSIDPDKDLQQAAHDWIDVFDGATLCLTVTFTDGSEQTRTLSLNTGRLAVAYADNVSGPVLTGELARADEPYCYGIYADIK